MRQVTHVLALAAALSLTLAGCKDESTVPVSAALAAVEKDELTFEQQIKAGHELYASACSTCHQANGEGIPGAYPPLANSAFMQTGPKALLEVILRGKHSPAKVNGEDYNAIMPPMKQLNDDEVANISTYLLNSWGNPGGRVSKAEVAKIR